MGRSFLRQETQIRNSVTYDDTVAAGSTMESAATTIAGDLDNIRSQVKRYFGGPNWYSDIGSVRTQSTIHSDLNTLEIAPLLFRAQVLTDITVTAAQNWEVLSVAGSETPSETAAVGAVTTEGAVVAFHSGTFGTHSLDEVAGQNAISPYNLCIVRDASDGSIIQSSGRDVYALIQSEIATDGHTFNDSDQRVQLSFVRQTSGFDDLEACPVADIQGKTINYAYVRQLQRQNVPRWAFLAGGFVDQAGAVDVTLDNAIDNQSGPATQGQDIDVRITDTYGWAFQDSTGAADIFKVGAEAAGDYVSMTLATLDINNTNDVDMSGGLLVDSGGTQLSIGSTAGEIESAGALALIAATDLTLDASTAGEIIFTDTNQGGSTFSGSLKLAETSGEWDAYEVLFGEVSLMNAIAQAAEYSSKRTVYWAAVNTAVISADTNVTGAGGSPNIDAQLGDYSALTFVDDVVIHLNGQLQRPGADAAANHDVYPGTTPANGDLMFEFILKINDVICMEIYE